MKTKLLIIIWITSHFSIFGQTNHKSDKKVYDITKSDNQLLNNNIIYYQMCVNWNLTADEIYAIIQHKKEEFLPEDIMIQNAYGFTPDGIFIYAKYKENGRNYHITLGSESWLTITDNSDKTKLYSCRNKNISRLFIGDYVTEGIIDKHPELEKRYREYVEKSINYLLTQKISSKWKDTNNAFVLQRNTDQTIDRYCIKIDSTIHLSVNNTSSTSCLFYEKDDTLYIYNNPKKVLTLLDYKIKSKGGRFYDSAYFMIQPGGFIFKIYKQSNFYYVASPYFAKPPYLRKDKALVMPIVYKKID